MFTLQGGSLRLCDRIPRRAFLRAGSIAGLGLSLPQLAQAGRAGVATDTVFGRAKRCILLFLTGGPPQHETWDPKPSAPAEIRGEYRPIASSAAGIQVCELFPQVAKRANRFCFIRSVTHTDAIHNSAGYALLTGAYHETPNAGTAKNIRPAPSDHPHLGSLVSLVRGAKPGPSPQPSPRVPGEGVRTGLPPFVALPEIIRDDAINTFPGLNAGFLSRIHDPLLVEGNDGRTGFRLPDISLPAELAVGRLASRQELWSRLDRRLTAALDGVPPDLNGDYRRAFDLLRSPQAQAAFDLAAEPDQPRDRYGSHLFGQGCLLARRLVEAGVSLVTVYWHYEGPADSPVWDTHQNNAPHMRDRLAPPTDQALAALLDDLAERGLLDDTLLVCLGEFGRGPKINRQAGRDHWPQVQSIVLAGAGIPAGAVYGSSDSQGAHPASHPVTPPDLVATLLHLLGVPRNLVLQDHLGRPVPANRGTPIGALLGTG